MNNINKKIIHQVITTIVILSFPLPLIAQETLPRITLESIMNSVQQLSQARTEAEPEATAEGTLTDIDIVGNNTVPDALILSEVIMTIGETLDPFKISRTMRNIQGLGFFTEVSHELQQTTSGGRKLIIRVVENPVLRRVEFTGNTKIKREELLGIIKSQEGDVFNYKIMREDIQRIEQFYKEKGYFEAFVQIEPPTAVSPVLVFIIREGILENVSVTGNYKTQGYVILREMQLKEGDVLHSETLREDLRRIFNLNYFTGLQPVFRPGSAPGYYDLVIDVTERETSGAFSFGGGYSPTSGFSVFTDFYWDNVLGTGQLIMLKGQFGRSTTYQFKYHNPWMWDERKSLTLRSWVTDGEIGTVSPFGGASGISFRNERRKGIDAQLGWPLSYEVQTFHKLKIEDVALLDSHDAYKIHSYTFSGAHDTRDVWFNPRKGNYTTLSIEKGFKLRKDSLDFTRYDFGYRQFYEVVKDQTLGLRFNLGYITSPDIGNQNIFSTEYYYVGGSTTVRGYPDDNPFASGDRQIILSLEYRFHLSETLQTILFLDTGYATTASWSDLLTLGNYRVGKGVGLRFTIPGIGPLRLDAGIDDLGTTRIHVNIGHAF